MAGEKISKSQNGWGEYAKYVLKELERLNKSLDDLEQRLIDIQTKDLAKIRTEIAMLKVKSGLWGAVAGMVPVIIVLLINYLSKGG